MSKNISILHFLYWLAILRGPQVIVVQIFLKRVCTVRQTNTLCHHKKHSTFRVRKLPGNLKREINNGLLALISTIILYTCTPFLLLRLCQSPS